MPLPEIKEGAAYDPNTDPNSRAFVTVFRDTQLSDNSIPVDAVQYANSGAIRSDAGMDVAASPASRNFLLSDPETTALSFMGYGRPGSVPSDGVQRDAYDWLTGSYTERGPWSEDVNLALDAERTVRASRPDLAGSVANPDVPVLPNGDAPVPEVQLRVFVDDASGRVVMSAQGSVFPNIPGSGALSNWVSDVHNSGASEYQKFEPLANEVYARVQAAYPGYDISIVGHSLAGGEAQTFALAKGISCGTLDSLPIAPQSIASIYGSEAAFSAQVADWQAQGNICNAIYVQGEIADAFFRQVKGEYYLDNNPTVLPTGVTDTADRIQAVLDQMKNPIPFDVTGGLAQIGAGLGMAIDPLVDGGLLHMSGEAWMRVRDLPVDDSGRAVMVPHLIDQTNREIAEQGITQSIVEASIAPIGRVNISNEPPPPIDNRSAAQRIMDGESPTGEPVNQWIGAGSAQYMWLSTDDGLMQIVNPGNGYVYETRFSSGTGEAEFSRYYDPATGRMVVNFDERPMANADYSADNYSIQYGDTLSGIAEQHGVPLSEILEANPSLALNPDRIFAGQVIDVPGIGAATSSESINSGSETSAANNQLTGYQGYLSDTSSAGEDAFTSPVGQGTPLAANDLGGSQPNAPHGGGAVPDLAAGVNTGADTGTPAWYSGSNQTANSYAQGMQSAISFIQALQQGNEFSAGLSGMSMLNAFARASGVKPEALPFDQTYTSGLGAVSAALNLRDALKADDDFGALVAGTNMVAQIGQTYIYATNSLVASGEMSLAQASPVVNGLGQVAGVLGIANSLRQGDELGAAIGVIMMVNPVLGIGLSIARALFGGDDPPEPRGTAEVRWDANGALSVAMTEDDDGGGKSAQGMMQSMLDTLNGYLGQQTDAHGDPSFALIPQRLPTVSFFQREYAEFMLNYTDDHGNRITRHYNAQGQRLGLDGNIESTFAEDFLDEVIGHNALVPKWEADTIRQRMDHGDSNAWRDETLPTPDEVKGGLMALTFHIPGAASEDTGTSARFDLDGDSFLDACDWAQPYQAFLALDRDGNSLIDSGSELITTDASASHRTASLEWLDANNDGILNASDPAFTALRVWLDVNSNAHTDDGELASLSQLGIIAIDFRTGTPMIVDGEGNTQPLTPKHLTPKGEGARIASDAGGTQIELQDGYKAIYIRAGDTRIQSAAPSPSVQQELARHTSNMSREAQGLFGGNAALLTGLAVAQTAAAGNAPATPLTLADVEHAINAAQSARTLGSDGNNRHYGESTATPHGPSPSFPLPEGEGGEPLRAGRASVHSDDPNTQYLAPTVQEGTPEYPDVASGGDAPAFTNPLTTGEIIAGAEDTALILTAEALLANDFSRNSNAQLRISAVGNATRGTVALLDTGEVVFTPELNYFGPASFTYTVTDQWGYASGALATVNLASVNDAPVIEAVEFGRPIFGYQSVTVRNYSPDWQPGWTYDYSTGQYYQDVPTLQAVNSDVTAQGLLTSNGLLNGSGNPLTPTYYLSGQLRPIAFDAIDATQAVDDGNGNITYTRIDDPTRQQGRVIAYDIDGDSTQITYGLGGNPAHGHASVGWMASASAEPWPTVEPGQLGNYAQYMHGAWQYASHPGDQYTGTDPFQVAITDGDGGVTLAAVSAWHHGTNQGGGGKKPVALDLDGNGLDFVGLDDSNVYFDVNGDGWREHIAWTGTNDGLLVLDTEGDRVIDKPEEISFARYLMGAVTDLEGLNAFDDNDDGILDKLDARFNDFAVWKDQNQNGISEEGEVTTLAERNIESINLTSDHIPQTLANGDVQLFGTGTYTSTDGQTHQLGDAAFRYTDEVLVTEAEVMRMALVFTQMSAAFGADNTAEPLAGIDSTAGDTPIVAYDDPTGLVPGGKT